jgi:branched-chain amino acid transport system permease protein
MKTLLRHPLIQRSLLWIAGLEVVALMTGPAGSSTAPTAGFHGSWLTSISFFGLVSLPRAVIFAIVGLLIAGVLQLRQRSGLSLAAPVAAVRRQLGTQWTKRPVRWSSVAILAAVLLVLPSVITDPFWQSTLVLQVAVYVLLATGLNVVVGFAGLLDLGFVAFYAIGAYVTAWLTGALPVAPPFGVHLNPFVVIPIAVLIAMIAGILLGAPTLRLRGDYLAIVTLGFGEIIQIFANNLTSITGGPQGAGTNGSPIPHFSINVPGIHYNWGLSPVPYYYLTLGFVVLFLAAYSLLDRSRVGRSWVAIREDEVAAESLGINPLKYKLMAFAIGASTSGFAGVLMASQTGLVFPTSFSLTFSINILVLVIFGGMGSIRGVVLGAVVIQVVTNYLLHSPPAWYQAQDLYIYLGALLIVMMIFRPAGLLPSQRRRRELRQQSEHVGHLDAEFGGDDL